MVTWQLILLTMFGAAAAALFILVIAAARAGRSNAERHLSPAQQVDNPYKKIYPGR